MTSSKTRHAPRSSRHRLDWRGLAEAEGPLDAKPGPVDVILPVYGAPEDLRRCLESLLAHTDLRAHHLLIIEDAGSDPPVHKLLAALAVPRGLSVDVLRNSERLGFAGSVNRGMATSERDVVLLNSDTEVTARWLEKLQAAAYSSSNVATATPFSNDATICSLPRPLVHNEIPADYDVASFAQRVERSSIREYPRIPTGVGMCLYIKRKVLDRVGLFDERRFGLGYGEENDFCLRALAAGYVHVLDDTTFVYHAGARSFGSSRKARMRAAHRRMRRAHPGYLPMIARFLAEDPLKPARNRVLAALGPRRRSDPKDPFPRVLHLVHGWPPWSRAGTEIYARWLATAQADRRLVAAYARVADPSREHGEPIEYLDRRVRVRMIVNNFTQRDPLERNSLRSRRIEADFARLLEELRPDLLHVHHLMGHSASLLRVAARRGVPILYQAQDWWAACARVNFTHRSDTLCSGPGIAKCSACFALTRLPPAGLPNRLLHIYRRWLMRRLLRLPAAFLMGSEFIARTYAELGLIPGGAPVFVRGYGVPLAEVATPRRQAKRYGEPRPLRFGFVGSLLPHKGAHLAIEAFSRLESGAAELELWGDPTASSAYTERLRRMAGTGAVDFRGNFHERDKATVLASFDALLVPSVGYESFGLVAREAIAVGTPVIVARGSALADLVESGGSGAAFESGDVAGLVQILEELIRRPETLARWSEELPQVKSFAQHAEEIEEVYRAVGGLVRRGGAGESGERH